jgi:hypothetical protein
MIANYDCKTFIVQDTELQKLSTAVINFISVNVSHFKPNLKSTGNARTYPSGNPYRNPL